MKKVLTISFLMLYLTLSVGLNIIVHSCGDSSETFLATTSVDDPCACSGMMPTDKCCTTVLTTVQVDDVQKASIASIDDQLTVLEIVPVNTSIVPLPIDSGFRLYTLTSFSPPPPNDLCISNSVFLI
jgi:hypothetical protein